MSLSFIYILVLSIFVSSVGGFIFYKLSYKFLLPKTISSVLGGILTLLLSYLFVMIFIEVNLLYGAIIALAIYIWFLKIPERHLE
ncbi:hypothetical protein SporoS204_03245 [Sporosarcina ureae]|uniref:YesK-like protein n=1 Tax=Sporosarcina ureae TaxID=1571 RepID=A0ABM6JSX6_SPOUR|nr:hypothetical protein SporoS204_03245 [Sporosarcina ureae]